MTGTGLRDDIIDAITGDLGENERDFASMWLVISNAIINYIKTNAVVNVTSVSGVTTGGGTSGPGTGTLS